MDILGKGGENVEEMAIRGIGLRSENQDMEDGCCRWNMFVFDQARVGIEWYRNNIKECNG